jgi:RNA polymerase sigma factor (sigma-70 family)
LNTSSPPNEPPTPRQALFLALVEKLRPELHRYCARLMGSVIDGEDVVQDTFARAFVALDELEERLAVSHRPQPCARSLAQPCDPHGRADRGGSEVADPEIPDPVEVIMRREAVETAVSRFAELPTMQRSVVIFKDVLDQSLEEIAAMLDLTVNAVKAHLARGRAGSKPSTPTRPRNRRRVRRRPPWPAMSRCSTSAIGTRCARCWPMTCG